MMKRNSDNANETARADFCIEIKYKKDSENPSRVFRTMSGLIDSFQDIDKRLVESIDVNIEPILMLEDIETGSIKVWLSSRLKAIPNDSLYGLNWKPIVGQYLVKAKYIIIDFLEGKTSITNIDEVQPLIREIYTLAEQTKVRHLPPYIHPEPRDLLNGIKDISSSLSYLMEEDSASYITKEKEARFNLEFKLAPESIEGLLVHETLTAESELILKVKKPDYLGESMWDFRHGDRIIQASILDSEWLEKFQSRKTIVHPGDSIRGIIKMSHRYDYNGELIGTHYDLIRVIEVIEAPSNQQLRMLGGDSEISD